MDRQLAQSYLGKHILIDITYLDLDGSLFSQIQLQGHITDIDDVAIAVRLYRLNHGLGEEFILPPDLDAICTAPRGEYRILATGEVVINPDLLATWTLTRTSLKPSLTYT
jgi:hypothetical protein